MMRTADSRHQEDITVNEGAEQFIGDKEMQTDVRSKTGIWIGAGRRRPWLGREAHTGRPLVCGEGPNAIFG